MHHHKQFPPTRRAAIRWFLSAVSLSMLMSHACAGDAPLRMVYFDNYEPISWGTDSKMQGVLVDIVDEAIVKRMGIPVEHRGYPWARAQSLVKAGNADAFITVATAERQAYTVPASEVVLTAENGVFVGANHPKRHELEQVTTLTGLKPYLHGNYLGNGWAKAHLTDYQVMWVAQIPSVLKMLRVNRLDAFVDSTMVVRYQLRKMQIEKEIVQLPLVFDAVQFRLCVRKDSPFVAHLQRFDSTIRAMRKDGTLDRIYRKFYINER